MKINNRFEDLLACEGGRQQILFQSKTCHTKDSPAIKIHIHKSCPLLIVFQIHSSWQLPESDVLPSSN